MHTRFLLSRWQDQSPGCKGTEPRRGGKRGHGRLIVVGDLHPLTDEAGTQHGAACMIQDFLTDTHSPAWSLAISLKVISWCWMLIHAYSLSIQEAEARGLLWLSGQPKLHSEAPDLFI